MRNLMMAVLAAAVCAMGCGSNGGTPMTAIDGGGRDSAVFIQPDASMACTGSCDDGIPCTDDVCAPSGTCEHRRLHARCAARQICDRTRGCIASPPCANPMDCADDDPCSIESCEASTATCTFTILDSDHDGDPPRVCGGTDCDDANASVHVGGTEVCNGMDDDCDGEIDEDFDLPNNPENCGMCGHRCTGGDVCAAGMCTPCGVLGAPCCAGTCYDGACAGGTCSCPGGTRTCPADPTHCVDTSSDPFNCGMCGNSCTGGRACTGGTCACPIGGCDGAVEVSAGFSHTCVRRTSGTATCWGSNSVGELGDGTTTHSTCCLGSDCADCSLVPVAVSSLTDAVEISVGVVYSCARRASGAVVCWGGNSIGQLGDGTTTDRYTPVAVSGLTDAVEISANWGHTCARRASGAVVCWGRNDLGQIGDGTTTNRLTPVAVSGLTDAVEISIGGLHSCARRASGAVVCWGYNQHGQLGDGTLTDHMTPTAVSGLTDAVEISASIGNTCARRASGAVVCWGENYFGQLGDGTTTQSLTPVAVASLSDIIEISSDDVHTCARRASGAVVCWGLNTYGQLGDGTTTHSTCCLGPDCADCSLVPVAVSSLTDAVEISVGSSYTCAQHASGAVVCWGLNVNGQLGDGTTTNHSTPVTVLLPP